MSGAVLKMQEEGKLMGLKTKWWKEMYAGGEYFRRRISLLPLYFPLFQFIEPIFLYQKRTKKKNARETSSS